MDGSVSQDSEGPSSWRLVSALPFGVPGTLAVAAVAAIGFVLGKFTFLGLEFVLANRCWTRAVLGRELPQALDDCDAALRLKPDNAGTLDWRGFTNLRLRRLDAAIADYDAALKLNPRLAGSLYGRGLAKRWKGDNAAGEADAIAAKAIQADIAGEFARYGVY
jgi:tetratricopeptide (TPR) repeat protein